MVYFNLYPSILHLYTLQYECEVFTSIDVSLKDISFIAVSIISIHSLDDCVVDNAGHRPKQLNLHSNYQYDEK